MLNIAVLGAGRIGQVHGKAVAATEGAQLVAVTDPFEKAAEELTSRFGGDVRSMEQIEADSDVDAVIICTPTDMHADLIERFSRAGKSVFCEKPVDLSVERVQNCLKVVEETGSTLMVGFNRRFDPDFNALKNALDKGDIGKTELVAITSRDPGPPPYEYIERSGGIFRDMMIHDFDIARWLLDDEVETVYASGSVLVDEEIGNRGDFDTASVVLTTASGQQATITNSRRAAYGYDQRIEVHGSEGAAFAQNKHQSTVEVAGVEGYTKPPLMDFFMDRYEAAYAIEIAAFVKAVSDGTEPPATGHDGLMALVLAEAADRSAREKSVISVQAILG
ncbi:MAG: inositol 2-dehydrogenase [Boseongicola sp.]|nr:inositol 2-dehydrogenase [Boseongicola sp.]MDD9979455.1 inositol 2-dehydrogenase [Boseongicola sp.]